MSKVTDYSIKNKRRRAARAASRGDFRQGRENRRAFAWNGAFGTEVVRVYNDCVLGTSGVKRQGKDDTGGDDQID
jgi:hypothetical protein